MPAFVSGYDQWLGRAFADNQLRIGSCAATPLMQAVRNANPALSTPEPGEHFADHDFATWHESRRTPLRLVTGFVAGDDATLTVSGPNPQRASGTWL